MSLLIVGAGCAGLSLAVHLVEAGIRQPIQLVDPREGYGSDRTWCSFRVRSHPFDECIAHRWSRWQLRYGGVVERQSPRHPYVHIPGEAFYAKALEILEGAPNVSLHLGVEGRALTRVGDKVHLETSAGTLEGSWAFDSRPVPHASSRGLVQHFRGFFVRTEEAVFTPDVAMLMDFDVPQDRGLRFAYVLPLREDMALIEDTFFTPSSFAIGEELLPHVLGDTAYNVVREEGGSIPMTVEAPPAPPEGVVRIGLAGGVAKPSSGYAFEWIQRHAAAITQALLRGEAPQPWKRSTWMDALFVDVLRRHPEDGPGFFRAIFEGNDAERIARFMTETATRRDLLGIMRSLPASPFLQAARRRALAGL